MMSPENIRNVKNTGMNTVTLIHRRSDFRNVDDSFRIYTAGAPIDELVESLETYVLPDGYSIGESQDGRPEVYGPDGRHCAIHESFRGRPCLVSSKDILALSALDA